MNKLIIVLMATMAPILAYGFTQQEIERELRTLSTLSRDNTHFPLKKYKSPSHYSLADKIKHRQLYFFWKKSEPRTNDRAEELLDQNNLEKNIFKMKEQMLTSGQSLKKPWSDSYWPIYKGILGARYNDPEFDMNETFPEAKNYIINHPAQTLLDSNDEAEMLKLSPSEKYDLLIGHQGYLTPNNWSHGDYYQNRHGDVATWMGICHGWADASINSDRPIKSVTVKSFDGKRDIKFYPADIKALISLIHAMGNFPKNLIGGRCNHEGPREDEAGRPIPTECQDTNPATWHISVVNQVGKNKASFVFDASYDAQVWNQPIISYKYRYFHPKTIEVTEDMQKGLIAISDFPEDKFKKYRSRKATHILGVSMELSYAIETYPRALDIESATDDHSNTVLYLYDLELDARGLIVGGEWHSSSHPDFLWMSKNGKNNLTPADIAVGANATWNVQTPVPVTWRAKAQEQAQRDGQPMRHIVNGLLKASLQ